MFSCCFPIDSCPKTHKGKVWFSQLSAKQEVKENLPMESFSFNSCHVAATGNMGKSPQEGSKPILSMAAVHRIWDLFKGPGFWLWGSLMGCWWDLLKNPSLLNVLRYQGGSWFFSWVVSMCVQWGRPEVKSHTRGKHTSRLLLMIVENIKAKAFWGISASSSWGISAAY